MWLRTKDSKWYICELRGVCFVTWVSDKDKGNAASFPEYDVQKWISILSEMTGFALEAVKPFV